jgi:L-seryl-tRNA(Ser) seleniumtransferase
VTDPRRRLPGVDRLLATEGFLGLLDRFPRARVVDATRTILDGIRGELDGEVVEVPALDDPIYLERVQAILDRKALPTLRPVINATGVVLHTNLGRAPLSEATREAMARAGEGYSNLEFDLHEGSRGSRYVHCVELLKEVTGAPDALVVNNNAAAVVLALNTVARGKEVLVSRGELVEIGGGFRIPDMLSRSGGTLREVGTTNRTRIADYREAAEGGKAGAILKVHRSNFRISGFTEETSLRDLADLSREMGLFLLHDLGSGLLAPSDALGLPPEPRAQESLAQGAHAVMISGDKLLGGPQAGIILGDADIIAAMKKNPLTRAFRVDKVTLAGLEATLRHYLDPEEAIREIPALRMLAHDPEALKDRSEKVASALRDAGMEVEVAEGEGRVGGGTYPDVALDGWVLRIRVPGRSAQDSAQALRGGEFPVVGRREDDDLVLDLRTVDPREEPALLMALKALDLDASGAGKGGGA